MFEVELLELDGGATIRSYSLHNVLGEEDVVAAATVRKRNLSQDVYDILLCRNRPYPSRLRR